MFKTKEGLMQQIPVTAAYCASQGISLVSLPVAPACTLWCVTGNPAKCQAQAKDVFCSHLVSRQMPETVSLATTGTNIIVKQLALMLSLHLNIIILT